MKKQKATRINPLLLFTIGIFSLGTIVLSCSSKVKKDEVIIYLVRHAEKDLSDPLNVNPELTEAGEARAERLVETMKGVKLEEIYTTDYTRNINTIQPLCNDRDITYKTYVPFEFSDMLDQMKSKKGNAFLICGHGDNLLPMVDYLGATRPVESLGHTEYDKIFKVKLTDDTSLVEMIIY